MTDTLVKCISKASAIEPALKLGQHLVQGLGEDHLVNLVEVCRHHQAVLNVKGVIQDLIDR